MSSFDEFANNFYGELARVTKAIGNKTRLEILVLLAQGERTVDSIAKAIGLPTSNTSHHLHDLRAVGAVSTRKEGVRVFYRISGDDIYEIVVALCGIAERKFDRFQAVVDDFLMSRDSSKPMEIDELADGMAAGDVIVLDVRPEEEFRAGHLPGAINVPLEDIDQLSLDRDDGEMVVYCRGPHCILAYEAVAKFRERGLEVRRFGGGFPEWKSKGLPVESGETD